MGFERTARLLIDGQIGVELTVQFIERDVMPDEFRVTARRKHVEDGPPDGVAIWHVKQGDEGFSLQITSQSVTAGICLVGCFADIVTGPLATCLKKAKNRKDVRACITQHGFWQAVSSISCVYGCLNVQ